ncbi:MAG: MlaD family protein [Candidatus Methylacidiphilales bacterium]
MKSKSQSLSDKVVAGIVIISSIVLLTAMAIPLLGLNFNAQQTVTIDLPTATGLRPNSEIRYAGAPVGKILKVSPLAWEERQKPDYAVRVIATINDDTPRLKKDSVAKISSDTLLAEKFIDLTPGSPDAPDLADNEVIYSKAVASFDDLTREGMVTLETLNEVLLELREQHPDLPAKVANLVGTADQLATKADALVESISTVLQGNEEQLNQTSRDLYVVMQNLKVVSTYSKALTATLGRKPWRAVWGTTPNALPSEEEILKSQKPISFELPKD